MDRCSKRRHQCALRIGQAPVVSVSARHWPRISHTTLRSCEHPDYEDVEEPSVAQLLELAHIPRIIAIGETGLDYYRLTVIGVAARRFRTTHIRASA